MFCPNCGTKNEDEALFCGNCGTRLVLDTQEQPAAAPVQAEVTTAPQEEMPVQETQAPQVEVPVQEATPQVEAAVQPETPAQEAAIPVQEATPVQPETPVQETAPVQPEMPAQGAAPQPVNQMPIFGQQPQQFNNQPVQGAAQPQQPKKPFKTNKKIVAIAAAVVVVAAALITFVAVGKNLTDYKKTAMQYVKAVAECEWNDAYALINVPDGEFLTKDAFINAHADVTGEKVEAIGAEDTITTYGKMPGNKSVKVGYYTASGRQYRDVYLTVSNKHYMLFFKKYKVSSENIVVKDCTIKVPKELTVYVNDKVVGDAYKSKSSDSSSYDEYVIPYLFYGKNDVKVTGDFIEDYSTQLYAANEGDTVTIGSYNIKYSDDKLEDIKTQAKTDVDSIVSAVRDKKDFSSISTRVASDNKNSVESVYKNMSDSYNDKYKTVSELKVTKFTASISDSSFRVDSDDGCPTIKIGLKLGYSYKIQYSSSDKATDKSNTSNSAYIYYKYEDGAWKITSMYLGFGFY